MATRLDEMARRAARMERLCRVMAPRGRSASTTLVADAVHELVAGSWSGARRSDGSGSSGSSSASSPPSNKLGNRADARRAPRPFFTRALRGWRRPDDFGTTGAPLRSALTASWCAAGWPKGTSDEAKGTMATRAPRTFILAPK